MLAYLMIVGAVFLRLTPHPPNFAPIAAMALFGGSYLGKKYALLIPLATMIVSDYFLAPTHMFHSTTFYVWGSFLISGLLGLSIRRAVKPSNIIAASFLASLQFFLITNFGVWATGMYSRSWDGLIQSYIMGVPFFRWTLLGDLFYTGVFFGSYQLAKKVSRRVVITSI